MRCNGRNFGKVTFALLDVNLLIEHFHDFRESSKFVDPY